MGAKISVSDRMTCSILCVTVAPVKASARNSHSRCWKKSAPDRAGAHTQGKATEADMTDTRPDGTPIVSSMSLIKQATRADVEQHLTCDGEGLLAW